MAGGDALSYYDSDCLVMVWKEDLFVAKAGGFRDFIKQTKVIRTGATTQPSGRMGRLEDQRSGL